MKCGTQMAIGVLGGYLLGRANKKNLAILMALLAAGGKIPINPEELLRRTPLGGVGGPLEKLTGDLRGQLIEAGKSVAMAAASSRIDSLSDKLQERAAGLRQAPVKKGQKRRRTEEPREEPEYEDEYDDEYEDEDEYEPEEAEGREEEREEERPRPRRPRSEPRAGGPRRADDAPQRPGPTVRG
ncbi:MAG: Uncharacterized protein JWO67_4611 [Streptosporangiaceae bacterium]|jgi:hypothetical protein|nr:Uncharacterized protein [Streptosporangiaceae bacterium]